MPKKGGEPEASLKQPLHEAEAREVELQAQAEELLRIQAELSASRDRYRALYDLAPLAYFTLDRSGRIQEANRTAAGLLGVEGKALVGQPLASFTTELGAQALERHLRHVFAEQARHVAELVLTLRRRGRSYERAVRIDSMAITDTNAPDLCHSTVIDLTELRQVRQEHQASEARSRTLLNTVADAVVGSDERGFIESFNPAAEHLFGYTEAEMLGRNVRTLMPEPYRSEHDGYMARYLATGEAKIIGRRNRELIGVRKDGTTFPLEIGIGEWWTDGSRKFTAIIHDISHRKKTELELRESEVRFRHIAEHVGDVFIIHDRRNGRVLYTSPPFEEMWGRTAQELYEAGSAWLDWLHPDDRERVTAAYERLRAGAPYAEEYRVVRPDGEVRWIRARTFPIFEPDGSVERDVGVLQDVTQRRVLEEELRQVQKMEAVGSLASGVAHDFNNVLQAVLGCLRVARDEGGSERAQRYLERAAEAIRRGGDLADQLMAFSRKRHTQARPLAMDPFVESLAAVIKRLVTEQVIVNITTAAPGETVRCDPVQIEQILMNLAANARDAMPEGGTLNIETGLMGSGDAEMELHNLDPSGRYLRLTVRDTGMGMDDATRRRIFEPFYTTKEVGRGTGLGLATVFHVVRDLGGHVHVDSTPGEGATFTLFFPAQPVEEIATGGAGGYELRLSGTVLLVEDEPTVRMTVREELEHLGVTVLEADGAAAAQRICETYTGPIDVLLTDVVMPHMQGPRLAEQIVERCPDIEVVFMSATIEDPAALEQTTVDASLLRKPFTREELAATLARMLETQVVTASHPILKHDASAGAQARRSDDAGETTVLLVEDEPLARDALTELLRAEGFHVLAAETPEKALELAAATPPDLLLTDLRLPGMNGTALAARLQHSLPELAVVVMSALPEPPEGIPYFVRKPVDFDALLEVLNGALASR